MTFQLTNISAGKRTSALHYTTPKTQPTNAPVYRAFGKRLFDLAVVVATSPVTVPLIAGIAAILAVSGQKPFYSQKRVGKNGRSFQMLKLRTMVEDADEKLATYIAANPEAKAEWDTKQKLEHDPRIVSPLGAWLRKTSLDELPQIFNVLNGTMSIVGPRPMMIEQQEKYTGEAYFRMRPGMTGPWQVSDRNECEFTGRIEFDEHYDADMSFRKDASIIVRTVGVVLRAKGC